MSQILKCTYCWHFSAPLRKFKWKLDFLKNLFGMELLIFSVLHYNISWLLSPVSPPSWLVFPAGEPVSGIPARWPAVGALRCAEWSASPMMPRAPAWWRTPSVPPTPRHHPLCRPATCTSAQSIVRIDGARWVINFRTVADSREPFDPKMKWMRYIKW